MNRPISWSAMCPGLGVLPTQKENDFLGGPSLPPVFRTSFDIPLNWSLAFCPTRNWPSEEAFIRKHPERGRPGDSMASSQQ